MFDSSWGPALYVSHFLSYAGLLGLTGGSFCLFLFSQGSRRLILQFLTFLTLAAVLAFHSILLSFLFQVGNINSNGLVGMFDWEMASFLLDLPAGQAAILRLLGTLMGLSVGLMALRYVTKLNAPPAPVFYHFVLMGAGLALLPLLFSFRVSGHVSVLPASAQIAIAVHLLTASIWLGSLLPLLLLCKQASAKDVARSLVRFGDIALAVVGLLVVSGAVIAWQQFPQWQALWGTTYGRVFLAKMVLFVTLLAIAAMNRFKLVPALQKRAAGRDLVAMSQALRLEIAAAGVLLLTTAYLSSFVGLQH